MKSQQNWASLIACQSGIVPMIEGPPGTGKTAVFRALANAANRRFLQVILGQLMPEDLRGIPVPSDIIIPNGQICRACNGTRPNDGRPPCPNCDSSNREDLEVRGVRFLIGEDFLRANHEPTLMLLDEFNQCGTDVHGAAQEIVNTPPEDCWMVAVSNPAEQSTNGRELTPPMVNRMCVVQWERPNKSRREGWRNGFRDYPAPDVPIVPPDFLTTYGANWGGLMCDFEDRFPSLFGEAAFPKDVAMASRPWPSDRSWTNVGILMAACDAVWANKLTRAHCVIGCVGEGAGNQFLQWAAMNDLPDPEDLLARPDQLKLPNRFDLVRTILGSVISAVEENNTPERWERLFDLIEVAFTQQPETSLASEGRVWKIKPDGHTPKLRNGVAAEMRKARLGS